MTNRSLFKTTWERIIWFYLILSVRYNIFQSWFLHHYWEPQQIKYSIVWSYCDSLIKCSQWYSMIQMIWWLVNIVKPRSHVAMKLFLNCLSLLGLDDFYDTFQIINFWTHPPASALSAQALTPHNFLLLTFTTSFKLSKYDFLSWNKTRLRSKVFSLERRGI